MSVGDIKTFDIITADLVLKINVIDLGGGQVRFDVQHVSGQGDLNAIYWGDDVADGTQFNVGGALNMNGSAIDYDGGVKFSNAGLGTAGVLKSTFLGNVAGEHFVQDATLNIAFDDLTNLGVRATSTGLNREGSIKQGDDTPVVTEAPKIKIDDQCVYEEDGTATFTVTLDHSYPYDITMNYVSVAGSANEGEDFQPIGGSFTILAGQTTYQLPVQIVDDLNPENTETFTIKLSNASADIPGTDIALAICDDEGLGTIKDVDVVVPPPPPPPPPLPEVGEGLSPGAYTTAGGEGAIPGELGLSFDDFFGLDAPAERIWTDGGVAFGDLTFTHALGGGGGTNGSAFAASTGPNDTTTPNMVAGDAELQLAREASVAAANFYSGEIDHSVFVQQLAVALELPQLSADAVVLAELINQVDATYNSTDVADYTSLTAALADTHH